VAVKKSPKPAPKAAKRSAAGEDSAEELARLRAELKRQSEASAAAAAGDDGEGEASAAAAAGDDGEGEAKFATYDPSVFGVYNLHTHSAVPNEVYSSLTQGDRQLKELVVATTQQTAKQHESLFTGFSVNSELTSRALQSAQTYGEMQRDRADKLREDLAAKDREIAGMLRASEEATLEKKRLEAQIMQGQQALERLELELAAKSRDKKAELDAVRSASAPVFNALASVVPALMGAAAGKFIGGGGGTAGLPSASGSGAPTKDGPPEAQVSMTGAAEWQAMVVEDLQMLKSPRVAACLRAMLCSYALGDHGAPPLPSVVSKKLLFELLVEELGQERTAALLMSCKEAYVAESPQAQQATAPN
jgi:hypothetical protein